MDPMDDVFYLAVGLLILGAFTLGAVLLERLRKGAA